MTHQPFVIERTFHAPVSKVWNAITDPDQMKQWLFDMRNFKPEAGTEFSFVGTDHDCRDWIHLCKVTEVVPQQKLAYTWRYEGIEGDSLVTWELFEEGDLTRLKLTHSGLETFPPLKSFARENFAEGWTQLIGSLLPQYLEKQSVIANS